MLQAKRNAVILLPNERTETITESGVVLDESYNPELGMRRGKVTSVGAGVKEVKVGDEACYMAFSGLAINYEGERYLTMGEEEVIAVALRCKR